MRSSKGTRTEKGTRKWPRSASTRITSSPDYRDFADDEIEARGMYGEADSDGVAECLMEYLNGEDPNEMCMEDFDEIISDNKRL